MGITRRKQGGSSTEHFDAITGAYSIEVFVANKDPFRVAPTNKIPVPYPYDSERCSIEARKMESDLQDTILEVVMSFGITCHSMCIQKLWQRGFPATAKDTVIVTTFDKDATRWEEAANSVYEKVKNVAAQAGIAIRVEIQNPFAMYCDVSSAIRDEDVYRSLMKIQHIVKAQVEKSCPTFWTSIGYHNRRPKYQDNNTDDQPTIMVFVKPGSTSLWGLIEQQIYEAVEGVQSVKDAKVALEILPGFNIPAITPELGSAIFQENIPTIPTNGASIGPQRSAIESGSLGAIVYFQAENQTAREKCIMTCYHVIAAGDPIGRNNNDQVGIGLYGRAVDRPIKVNCPSRHDMDFTKRSLSDMIAEGEDLNGSLGETLSNITERFPATRSIGYVKHASGLRLNDDDRRMDWALVVLDSPGLEDMRNEAPPSSHFPPRFFTKEFVAYNMTSTNIISQISEPINHTWVGKQGRTTQTTAGEVNLMDRTVNWANGMVSTEVEVLSLASGYPFAEGGDSGSLVFNLRKEWVGMTIGADCYRDMGYLTPVHDIIADVKLTTGGTITLA